MHILHTWAALSSLSFVAALHPRQVANTTKPYTYDGCYAQANSTIPALDGPSESSKTAEVTDCAAFCSGYQSFSIEADWICTCGNTFNSSDSLQPLTTCSGDCDEKDCRAGEGISLYTNNNYTPPVRYDDASFPYIGCYLNTNSSEFLEETFTSPAMTVNKCVNLCLDSGMYYYFAVEDGTTCYCSSYLAPSDQVQDSECDSQCGGDGGQICGGQNRLTMYGKPQLQAVVGEEPYYYQGCYPDNSTTRQLGGRYLQSETMDLETCREACADYPNFGVGFGKECFCGRNEAWRGAAVSNDHCSTPCAGHTGLACGGYEYLSIYSNTALRAPNPSIVNGYNKLSCWTHNAEDPSLAVAGATNRLLTLDGCRTACREYEYFAALNGTQCLCGNALAGGAALENQCNVHCAGDVSQWCGGADHLYVYKKANLPA
ncbi:hypothetical protein BROUX41_002936 [Berkeleyomyces rouxiae]|uniref:uncharacterized protein n=1 Tax=Berkeleyomyces rouxiae TaxID=2035830 RepID=UPI003B78AF11